MERNPIFAVQQQMCDLEHRLAEAKSALLNQLYAKRKYESYIAETEAVVEKRTQQVNLALAQGDVELAVMALEDRLECERRLRNYRKLHKAIEDQGPDLEEQVQLMNEIYEQLFIPGADNLRRIRDDVRSTQTS